MASEVAIALTKYAEKEGWKRDDYWIYYYINSDWNYISFVYVSRHFNPEDERSNYVKVWDFLVDYFKDDPEILRYASLVVSSKAQVDQGGLYSIGPKYHDYRELWPFYTVPQP
jgi:hypothetical protein